MNINRNVLKIMTCALLVVSLPAGAQVLGGNLGGAATGTLGSRLGGASIDGAAGAAGHADASGAVGTARDRAQRVAVGLARSGLALSARRALAPNRPAVRPMRRCTRGIRLVSTRAGAQWTPRRT